MSKKLVFTTGVNFPYKGKEDVRFEAGADVPADVDAKTLKALNEMNAVAEKDPEPKDDKASK